MKNRSIAQIIFGAFFKTIGIILLLLGIGVLSYYLTMLFLKQTARVERSTQYEHVIDINTGNESSNLIYSFDEKTKKIEAIVLELFDAGTKNMTYITIPANTQITISSKTYDELLKKNGELPQMVTMSQAKSFFPGDVGFEYAILILQEEYKVDIGYFTAMSPDVFQQCFEKENGNKLIYRPSKALLDEAAACKDEDDMSDLMEDKWDKLISDITLSQKQHYAKELLGVKREMIHTYRAYGSKSSGVFKLAKKKNQDFVDGIWEKKAYTSEQKKNASDAGKSSSNGSSIFIYNGSQITGLAAKYKEKIEADGHTVIGVGNATGGVRTKTTIYAKKKKEGKALQKYFKNATVEQTSSMSSGADIEIVLGTEDDLS